MKGEEKLHVWEDEVLYLVDDVYHSICGRVVTINDRRSFNCDVL